MKPKKNTMPDLQEIEFGRNEKWRDGLYLGLVAGIVYAPSSFWACIHEPVADLVFEILKLLVGLSIWGLTRLTYIGLGILGLVKLRQMRYNGPRASDSSGS